jgi:hypothetical protein
VSLNTAQRPDFSDHRPEACVQRPLTRTHESDPVDLTWFVDLKRDLCEDLIDGEKSRRLFVSGDVLPGWQ